MPVKLSQRLQRLRDAGYRLTNARMLVVEVLENCPGHLSSTEVIEEVAARDASIGRASVFRTLDLLTNLALIRPTFIDSSATPKYVLLPGGHHHHIVCTNCNRVVEFEDCELTGLANQLEARYGMKISGHLLEFYGTCLQCEAAPVAADRDNDE